MGQYQIFVGADTKSATSKLKSLDKVVDTVTKIRELKIKFPNTKTFERNIRNATKYASDGFKQLVNNADGLKDAFNNVKTAANPRSFLTGSFAGANVGAQSLLDKLAKISIAFYGLNSAANVLKGTFGSLFAQTIGQANAFEEQLLKTKTTLASTSDVFVDGKKVTDPLKAIESLTGVIDERIESIRLRTIDIAGVTSGEVVEVFGIVASQAGQIGASLEDAENLAISFAAALGTFGLPLRQARQEITSILQGNVNVDSYLAQALQISNEDIAKARTQVGGIAKFLEDRLSTAVAGQAIAAKTLGGVLSNVRDIWEEFTRSIGSSLLNPLIGAVTVFYDTLGDSLKTIKSIGTEVGKVAANIGRGVANAAGFGSFDQSQLTALQASVARLLTGINATFLELGNSIQSLFESIQGQLGTIFANFGAQIAIISEAFAELGRAVLVLTSAQIESFVGAVAQLIPILTGAISGVGGLIKVWAEFLKLPIVQSFVRFQTTLKVLEATGVKAIVLLTAKIVLFRGAILKVVNSIRVAVGTVLRSVAVVQKAIGTLIVAISRVVRQITILGVKIGVVSKKSALEIKRIALQMQGLGVAAKKTGGQMGLLAKGVALVAGSFKALLRTTGILLAIEVALVAIVEAISLWQRKQAEAARQRELQTAIATLDRTAEAAAEGGLTDLQTKLREIAQQKVTDEIERLAQEIAELDEKISAAKAEAQKPVRFGGEFDVATPELQVDVLTTDREQKEKEFNDLKKKLDKDRTKEDVEVRKKEGKKLEKELAEFRKSLADDEFRYRQRLAQGELDKMRAQQALELQRMERALKKRLEGEEGASRIFLENLNTYLSKKKRGEDDIAARQKQLQITLANLQKEIADYKYNTEKKIAELQKKMGKYQMEVADHKLKQARNEAKDNAVDGGGYYTQGNIGPTSTGPHFDIKRTDGKFFERDALDKYVDVNGGALSAGTTVPGGRFGAARSYGQHRGWDYAFGDGAKLSLKGGAQFVSNTTGGANGDATIFMTPDGTKYQILHGKFTSQPQSNATVAPAPEAPDLDLGGVDPSKITASLSQLKNVLADINALKDEMTRGDIAAAFEDVTSQVFGTVQLEPLQDALKNADDLFKATADSAKEITDAQKLQIEYQTELNRKATERDEMIKAVRENELLTAEEKASLEVKITEEYDKHIQKLDEAQKLKADILATTQATLALEKMRSEIQTIEEQTADNMLRMRLEMEGLSQIEVDAEIRKARAAREYGKAIEDAQAANNPEQAAALRKEYERLAAAIDKAAKVQMEMRNPLRQLMTQWKKDLTDVNAMYAQMAQTVQSELASAMSNAITGVITGTQTVQEAMANMFKNIGKAFLDMATQMIAKAIVMKALGLFLPGLFGGGGGFNFGSTPLGAGGGSVGGIGTLGPNFGFQVGAAQGAYVNSATPALIGEGGVPEYVIPENKMASSMMRFSQGMRGKGVVEGADTSFGSQNRSQAQPTALGDVSRRFNPGNNYSNVNNYDSSGSASDNFSINITGEQLVFNEKNYVSQDEIPNIISQASKSGEARTLRKLRMSQSTRKLTGI